MTCRVADPKDLDLRITTDSKTSQEADTFLKDQAFTWKAVDAKGQPAGDFPKGNLGQEVLWLAPKEECSVLLPSLSPTTPSSPRATTAVGRTARRSSR